MLIKLKSKISAYLNIEITKLYTQLKSYPDTFSIYVILLQGDQLSHLPKVEGFPMMWDINSKATKVSGNLG